MKTQSPRLPAWLAAAASLITLLAGTAHAAPPVAAGAATLGGALPGGAVISARSVILTPSGGGLSTAVPIGSDGAFRADGLKPGHYTLRIASVTVSKQTQGATFGEKVQAGLHQAGSALASGAQLVGSAAPADSAAPTAAAKGQPVRNDMPSRLSMNVTVARQAPRSMDVDGDGIDVEVPADGAIAGIAGGAVAGIAIGARH
jgi:hypothetical protein